MDIFKKYWSRFLKYAKLYLSLPELTVFWLFLFSIVIVSILNIFLLSGPWAYIVFGFFAVMATLILLNGIRLAKSNLEIKIERNQLTGIVNNLKDGVVAYDINFNIVIFNRAAEQIFDISAGEVMGKIFDPSYAQKARYRLLAQAIFPSLAPIVVRISAPETWPQVVDISFEQNDLDLRIITNRITDSSGLLLGFFKIISDRTREKEMIRSKSEFITIAAHQLRTPLTGINWTLETLDGTPNLPTAQAQMVKDGLIASQRLLRVVNDLLDVAKIEEGKFGYQFEDFDLLGFLAENLSATAALAKEYKVKVFFDQPDGSLIVRADPAKLRLVFSNLLDNALKYNVANGEIRVRAEKIKEKPYARVMVQDTGIGIPADEISRLFTKFFRGSNVTKVETTGSGLGLFIAKNIIKRHGGEISAESTEGRGTTFSVILPTDPKLIPPKEMIYEEGI